MTCSALLSLFFTFIIWANLLLLHCSFSAHLSMCMCVCASVCIELVLWQKQAMKLGDTKSGSQKAYDFHIERVYAVSMKAVCML